MLCRAGLILAFCGTANAQSAAEQLSPSPKNCDAFYPAQDVASSAPAETDLAVHVSKDGTLSNISVIKSSGGTVLDAAAIACAKVSRKPQTSAGEPVELDWQGTVRKVAGHFYLSVPPGTPCPFSVYPMTAVRRGEQGQTKISFSIGADGNATNGAVVQSSGYSDLDQAALRCLAYFRFPVPTQDGKPIQVDGKFGIGFGLSN